MDEGFDIPVTYKGKDLLFPARLVSFGYPHKIEVDVYGTLVHFERDEEREWRALMASEEKQGNQHQDAELLQQLILSLERILQ
jgi:hypothetical protein